VKKKKKILMFSDHPLATSGVGIQARYLINGLLKTGEYSFRCFGAAVKHNNYDVVNVSDDFVIKPIDGFGDKEMIRLALATEKPDAIFLFTDPRFFMHIWEMEDEIHQICPIVYWHVWDNDPWPDYNHVLYEGTDLINCHSYKTYEMVNEHFPNKTNFAPHGIPKELFYRLSKPEIIQNKQNLLGTDRGNHFVGIWVNRNARRKKPSDVLLGWKLFLDKLQKEKNHKNATLIMHTDPQDQEGPNLYKVAEHLEIVEHVFFSTQKLEFPQMNILYNISDFCINVACAEGFGLSTLEAMQTGTPIIAQKTGGLIRQVVDHRDGTENGVAIDPDVRTLVGSQMVPYIYEDHVSDKSICNALWKLYSLGDDEYDNLSIKVESYAHSEFDINDTINVWHKTLSKTISNWKKQYDFVRITKF
jgi:glycosyltransferase involved in cell wall biosynthesis